MVALTLACLAGANLSASAGGTEPEPGEGSVGLQLLDAPGSRRDDPRALRYIVHHLPPGAVIHREVVVANKSDVRRHVELYPEAATVEHGRFVFDAELAANELTSWISLEPAALDLAPGEHAKAMVTISVPPAASVGEQYAVVWAAVGSEREPAGDVRQVRRIGVRVYLDVGTGEEPRSAFEFGRLTATRDEHGRPVIVVEVANTGARAVDLFGTATLTDGPAGTHAGLFDVPAGTTLAPGQSCGITVRFPPELPDGPWTIAVHLESGTVRNSTTARVSFSGDTGEAADASVIPWLPVFGVVLGLVLITVGGMALRARHTSRRSHQTPAPRAQGTA